MEFKQVIARLNELYQKSQQGGLTEAEIEERNGLRREYLAVMRTQLKASLDRIQIVDADGNPVEGSPDGQDHQHQHGQCSCHHDHCHHKH